MMPDFMDDLEERGGPHQLTIDGTECVRCGESITSINQLAEECVA